MFVVLNYVQMFVFDFIQLFSASHGLKPRELQEQIVKSVEVCCRPAFSYGTYTQFLP